MDELVNLVVQKTGIPKEQARQAVETVLNFLKERLPAPIAGQLETLIQSSGGGQGLDDLAKGLGGLLGRK